MDLQCITDKTTIYKEIKQKVKKKSLIWGKRENKVVFSNFHIVQNISFNNIFRFL